MQGAITSNNQEHHPCEGQHEGGRECREQVSRQHSKAKYDRHITDEGEQHDIPSSPVLVPAIHSYTIHDPGQKPHPYQYPGKGGGFERMDSGRVGLT